MQIFFMGQGRRQQSPRCPSLRPLSGYFIPLFITISILAFLMMAFLPSRSYAACIDPDGVPGEIMFNNDYDVFQGCTLRGWAAFHTPKIPPQGCPNIGVVCTGPNAGMIYAGEYNGYKLYIAADDAPSTLAWGPLGASGMERCTIGTESSCMDGFTNTQILKNHTSTYPAAEYCANLSAHGYGAGKWYLPSKDELNEVYKNLKQGEPAGKYNFLHAYYWTSSDTLTDYSITQHFNSGNAFSNMKTGPLNVRCVYK